MRTVTDHHDGHGLAESIVITCDELDPNAGLASHEYVAHINNICVLTLRFQQGPRNVMESKPGIIDSVLLAIVVDRMRSFNAGTFPARENALVMTHCQEAIHWLKHRADERAKRGVLGVNVK
jgi:hypothetical protein